jgi:uncharacterized membrane protein (UPF0127 family)
MEVIVRMKLVNLSNSQVLAEHVREARTFWKRFRGLMFTVNLPAGDGLHIQPCRSVHTFFMNYSIDVLHLDSSLSVVAAEKNLKPGKLGKSSRNTASIVELPAGTIDQTKTEIGQTVQFKNEKECLEC